MAMRGLALLVALVVPSGLAAQDSIVTPHRINGRTVAVFETWIAAVNGHGPGLKDAPLETVVAFSMAERAELSAGMALFVGGLTNKGGQGSLEDPAMRVKQLGHRAAQAPGTLAFLKRAALLHADAAIAAPSRDVEPARADNAVPGSRRRAAEPETPILTQHRLSAGDDGKELGEVIASWHWPFARFLLDVLERVHAGDAFIADWYHATSALLLARRAWGELEPQLDRASTLLPSDARAVFDRAC